MRSLFKKSKSLLKHSARARELIRQMPGTAAEIQGLVAQATSTIQQLRLDAGTLMGDLKVENDDRFGEILRDVTAAQEALLAAGYTLRGASINLGSLPAEWSAGKPTAEFGRLTIHLERSGESLLSAAVSPSPSKTLQAVFHAIGRAHVLSENMAGFGLVLAELFITIGPLPSIKIVWDNALEPPLLESEILVSKTSRQSTIKPSWSGEEDGFFPERPKTPISSERSPEPPVAVKDAEEAVPEETMVAASDPLARFKKMPDLNR